MIRSIIISFLILFSLTGCGEGDGSGTVTGQFIDAPVQGLSYTCSSGATGETNSNGEYTCIIGDSVTFFIGSVEIGTSSAQTTAITPYTLFPSDNVAAINLARLLQSVDTGSVAGSIVIDTALEANIPVDTDFSHVDFSTTIQDALSIVLVSETEARTAMNEAIIIAGGIVPADVDSNATQIVEEETSLFTFDEIQAFVTAGISTVGQVIADEYYKYAWHIEDKNNDFTTSNGIDSSASANIKSAWEITRGQGVLVAVIDDSFNATHEDLKDNIVATYNAKTGSSIVFDSTLTSAHGTAVSGIVGASANDKGVVGVAPDAKLLLISIGEGENNSDLTLIDAFEYARTHGAHVVSCSWGTESVSESVSAKIKELYDDGITVVFASGNSGKDLDTQGISDESELPWVIGVGASSETNNKTQNSNYGKSIDILAPSGDNVGIVTTDEMGYTGRNGSDLGIVNKNYTFLKGTSASAPIVSGVVALLLSEQPDLSPAQIRYILINSADKIGGVAYNENGWNSQYAYGKINAYNALQNIDSVPTAAEIVVEDAEVTNADPDRVSVDVEYRKTLSVSNTYPADGNIDISVDVQLTIRIQSGESINQNSMSSVTLSPAGGRTLSCTSSGRDGTCIPSSPLDAGTDYTVNWTGMNNGGGDSIASRSVTFTTAAPSDTTPPNLTSVSISSNNGADSTKAIPGDNVIVTFTANEPLNVTSTTATIAGQSAAIINTAGTTYTATYTMTSGQTEGAIAFSITAFDVALNDATPVSTITTGTSVTFDKTAPTISTSSPLHNATSVAVSVSPNVTFSETMDSSTLTNNITLSSVGGTVWSDPEDGVVTLLKTYAAYNPASPTSVAVNDVNDGFSNRAPDVFWAIDATFPASPLGALMEHGGTGSGSFIGFSGGNFIARAGTGATANTFAIVTEPASTFANKSGTVFVAFSTSTDTATVWFQENSTGEAVLIGSNTSGGDWTTWSGTNDGYIGNDNGSLAGSYPDVVPYNGGISAARLYNNYDNSKATNQSLNTSTGGGSAVSGTVTDNGTTATFNPTADLDPETSYDLVVSTSVTDTLGNAMASEQTISFTTASADAEAPTVSSNSPADSAADISIGSNVTVTFNEAMDSATLNGTNITISPAAAGAFSDNGTTVTFNPTSNLVTNTTYTVTVGTGVTDVAGNNLASNHVFSFTTEAPDITKPTVSSKTPSNGSSGVAIGSNITVTFSEPMNSSTLNTSNVTVSGGVTGTVTDNGTTLTFNPSSNLAYSTSYTVTVSTGVQDVSGNALNSNHVFSFTTEDAETVPPTISSISPSDTAIDVSLNANVVVTFSEDMAAGTINTSNIVVKDSANAVVSGTVSLSGNVATFSPDSTYEIAETYSVTVSTAVTDLVGNNLGSQSVTTFTTALATCAQTNPLTICYTVPEAGGIGILEDTSVAIRFSEVMSGGMNVSGIILKNSSNISVVGSVSYDGFTATFEPDSDLDAGETYTLVVDGAVSGAVNGAKGSDYSMSFTTIADASADTFRDDAKKVVVLTEKGQIWQDDAEVLTTRTWSAAKTYCEDSTLGGYDDWYLPDVNELKKLADDISENIGVFNNTVSGYFWSSETYDGNSNRALDVRFNNGAVNHYGKGNSDYVRCVRSTGGSEAGVDQSEAVGTITMNSDSLMWQDDGNSATVGWQTAVDYCAAKSLATYTDWRLPTIGELSSIVDTSVGVEGTTAFIDPIFQTVEMNIYWSSTSADRAGYAKYIDFYSGNPGTRNKISGKGIARCVRNK
ncbi:Ig-like domain-containing protein [Candidatus Sulfurimonas baltica]|uniref:Ig-like domain-containing protein n=1 Tax=Candidatus Sulfurimonas baltica TaxID=2740404 RepID=A0A7S7LUY1_9BACT|nr:Ig-like domain-containing protein [Candidatus Sulfurimonas baltica]QOY51863.1 Ig-like domain-containing protein [Candidatus Sulfurimonas baltica]